LEIDTGEGFKSKIAQNKLQAKGGADEYWILGDEMDGAALQPALTIGEPTASIPRQSAAYLIDRDGGGLERLTWTESFASFPMFSRDGSQLVFCSNRGAAAPRDLDVFICDWVA
ncbi:MAG: hypothetical protein AAB265_10095, partial [candidate division NC10 bacterium]